MSPSELSGRRWVAQVVIVLCPGLPHFSTLVFVLHGSKRAAKNREVQDMREGGGGGGSNMYIISFK